MAKKERPLDAEKDAIDLVTGCMSSLILLKDLTELLLRPESKTMSVSRFYEQWAAAWEIENRGPLTPGAVLGYLYVGIVFAKETWFELVPNLPLTTDGIGWGLDPSRCHAPLDPSITVKSAVRRIRNALGHARVTINVHEGESWNEMFERTTFSFHDEDPKQQENTFDATLTIPELFTLIREFHAVAHAHVRTVTAPAT